MKVNPPRAGLDEETLARAAEFATVIYISCNPATLASNVRALAATHDVVGTQSVANALK